MISPVIHPSIIILDPDTCNWCCCSVAISTNTIPSRRHYHRISSYERASALKRDGHPNHIVSIDSDPLSCTNSERISAKSGSVSISFIQLSRQSAVAWNASTLPASWQCNMCSVVYTSTVQHEHFVHLLLRYDMYLFVGAIHMTLLHAHSWKTFGTFSYNVLCTCGQYTFSNWRAKRTL